MKLLGHGSTLFLEECGTSAELHSSLNPVVLSYIFLYRVWNQLQANQARPLSSADPSRLSCWWAVDQEPWASWNLLASQYSLALHNASHRAPLGLCLRAWSIYGMLSHTWESWGRQRTPTGGVLCGATVQGADIQCDLMT